jgi:hypothetical protein
VEVSSAFNEPVEGGQVTFTAPSSGASAILSGTPAAIGTDGQASATATANDTAGSYTVSATAAGSANTVNFELTNTLLPGRTPKGTNIQVKPIDPLTGSTPVSVTFPSVTQEGMTSLEITSIGLPPPAGFKSGVPSNYYHVSTTAEFTGPVTLAINYAGTAFSTRAVDPIPMPRGFHLENGVWVDRTSTTDHANKVVYVSVWSLSPFALFAEKLTPTVSVTDAGGPYNGSPYGATNATVTGAGDEILASFGDASLSYTYYQGTTPLSSAPTTPGDYSVVAHYAGNDDYNAADSVPVTFTITWAPLTITANDWTKITGEANPLFTVSYSGFVLGEGPSVLGGTLTFATPPTPGSPPGTYAITPGGLTSSNYAITFNRGTLTVLSYGQATTKLMATVDAAGLAAGTQNALDSQLQAAIASFNRGSTKAGVNQLGAFINYVGAQRGKKIAAALADDLVAYAQRIINATASCSG